MLSNRLTFSLASLVVLLVFLFVATSVTEAQTRPTVTKIEADPATTTQARNAFVVRVTFSTAITVANFDPAAATDVRIQGLTATGEISGGVIAGSALATVPLATGGGNTATAKVITFTVADFSATTTTRQLEIEILNRAVDDNIGKTEVLMGLPPVVTDMVSVTAAPVSGAPAQFTVTFKFGDGTTAPATLPTATDVRIDPTGSATVSNFVISTNTATPGIYTATVSLLAGTTSVTVDVDPSFAAPAAENGSVMLRPGQDPSADTGARSTVGATLADDTVTLSGMILKNGFDVIEASDLPDLNSFFVVGGTISLIAKKGTGATARTAKDVVISEILWGVDQAKGTATERAVHQFIELYNTTGTDIDLSGMTLEFNRTSVVPTDPGDGNIYLDQVSNVYLTGWAVDIGQSGRLSGNNQNFVPVDLVSMYRNIDYVKVEKAPAGDAPTKAERDAQLKDFPDGKVKGSWKASTKFYMTGIIASKEAKHIVSVSVLTPTAVPYSPVIINEIGSFPDANKKSNWIELRAIADVNLKNYQLSYITDDAADEAKETALIHFNKDKDQNLVAGDILLIVNDSPRDTMLARGKKFGDKDGVTPDEEQDPRGGVHEESMYYDADGNLDKLSELTEAFLLVLRSEPKANHEKIVDLTGTYFHPDTDKAYRTAIFPLQGAGKGHDDVVDGDPPEVFRPGYAYERKKADAGTAEHTWGVVGYTGIGYDREAPMDGQYGGTPGFPNNALKSKPADISSDVVTISEIMVFSQDGQFPQWIELRNSSSTLGVNLDNWKLRVENVGDVTARQSVTIDLPNGFRLPPNGTILIVTRPGTASDELSKSRVINLYADIETRRKIEVTGPRYTLLSTEGFTLKLFGDGQKDTDASPVDIVTIDADMLTEEMIGNRSGRISLIRYYGDGVPGAWGSSMGSNQVSNLLSEQYYGHRNDIGTPGWYPGGALPVSLSSFRPMRDKATGAVVIRWATESELDNAGFNILRSETKTGEFKVINLKGIIPGHGTTSEKHTYEWTDTTAKPNVVYYYQIEDVSLDGKRTTLRTTHLRGNVTAAGKATTTWADLKTLRK